MEAAVRALRNLSDGRIIVAAPVGAAETCERLRGIADEVVCPHTPEPFTAVGLWYDNFEQTSDAEVKRLLETAGGDAGAGCGDPPHRADSAFGSPIRRSLTSRRSHAWQSRRGSRTVPAARSMASAARAWCCWGKRRMAPTSSIASGRSLRDGSSRSAASRRWPSRPTGPMRIGSTATCAAPAAMKTRGRARRLRTVSHLDVAQRRRARFHRLAADLQRRQAGERASRLLRSRPLQPAGRPPRPCWRISTKWIQMAQPARVRATAASIALGTRCSSTATRPASA